MIFSVIIPVYNAQNCIGAAIESVLNQKISDWEMIIVNNCSTDRTPREIEKYRAHDSRIKVINCSENSGSPARPRNLGLQAAQGEYIAFLDADDTFFPGKLAEVEKYFNEHPDVDCICHGERHIKNDITVREDYYGPYTTYKDLFFRKNSLSTSAVVMRRNCIEKAGFFSEEKKFSGFEDYDYWLRVSKVCRIKYLKKILGCYTINENTETSKIAANYDNALKFLEANFAKWENKSLYYRFFFRKRKGLCLRSSAREFMRTGGFDNALPLLQKAVLYNPFCFKSWIFTAIAISNKLIGLPKRF